MASGAMIIFKMESIIGPISTGTYDPASHCMANGVTKGESSVETAVMLTESGTFPFAR